METDMTVLNVTKETKALFDNTITKSMSQDQGVKALLDFWIRYKLIVNK